jgi:hypothetical protein
MLRAEFPVQRNRILNLFAAEDSFMSMFSPQDLAADGNQCRVARHALHTDSITGTSTSTPTTVARAAPEPGPYGFAQVATAARAASSRGRAFLATVASRQVTASDRRPRRRECYG